MRIAFGGWSSDAAWLPGVQVSLCGHRYGPSREEVMLEGLARSRLPGRSGCRRSRGPRAHTELPGPAAGCCAQVSAASTVTASAPTAVEEGGKARRVLAESWPSWPAATAGDPRPAVRTVVYKTVTAEQEIR